MELGRTTAGQQEPVAGGSSSLQTEITDACNQRLEADSKRWSTLSADSAIISAVPHTDASFDLWAISSTFRSLQVNGRHWHSTI